MSKRRTIWRQWQLYRALAALVVTGGIMFALLDHRNNLVETSIDAVGDHLNSGWKISELFIETLRLNEILHRHENGTATLDDVALRYDIVWGRVETAKTSTVIRHTGMSEALAQYEAHLERFEPFVFGGDRIPRELAAEIRTTLKTHMLQVRQDFRSDFIADDDAIRAAIMAQNAVRGNSLYSGTLVLVLCLLGLAAYFLAEIVISFRSGAGSMSLPWPRKPRQMQSRVSSRM